MWPKSSPEFLALTSRSEDTVRSFKEIIEGKHDAIPEQAFYLKGGIEDVLKAAEKMQQ